MDFKTGSVHRYYFDHPELWDATQSKRYKQECQFLIEIFKKYGKIKTILDVGCGSGVHVKELNDHGYNCLGIDLNDAMINYATKQFSQLKFEIKGMKDVNYQNQYDALISLCTVFSYNLTNEESLEVLIKYYNALKPGGLIIIDVFNPITFIEKNKFKGGSQKEFLKEFGLDTEGKSIVDENKQIIIDKRIYYKTDSKEQIETNITEIRMFFPQELKFFLTQAGFKFLEFYGDFNINYKTLDKFRMIVLAQKPL